MTYDVVTMGRVSVDVHPPQVGAGYGPMFRSSRAPARRQVEPAATTAVEVELHSARVTASA